MKRSAIKRDLRSPKYRPRIIPNKRKQLSRMACRKVDHGTRYVLGRQDV